MSEKTQDFKRRLSVRIEKKKLALRISASDFNLVSILDPDEIELSKVLAKLLDPRGGHGQGTEFLTLFIETLKVGAAFPVKDLRVSSVGTEVPIKSSLSKDGGGRLDIVIEFHGGWVLVIENKPWAGEGKDQILRYCECLRARHKNKCLLVFLRGAKQSPKNTPEIKIVDYDPFLTDWLQRCIDSTSVTKLRVILEDFRDYAKTTFERPIRPKRADFTTSGIDSEEGKFVIQIFDKFLPEIWEKLNRVLPEGKRARQRENPLGPTMPVQSGELWRENRSASFVTKTWQKLGITQNGWDGKYYLVIENSKSRLGGVGFGIWRTPDDNNRQRQFMAQETALKTKIENAWRHSGNTTGRWYLWRCELGELIWGDGFDPSSWLEDETVLALCEKKKRTKFVNEIVGLFVRMYKLVDKDLKALSIARD